MLGIFHSAAALLYSQNSIWEYWHRQTDPRTNPFRGMYQLNSFDLYIIIPYFIVLFILAMYGLHRYWLVYNFYKYSRQCAAGRSAGSEIVAAGDDSAPDF